jgi:hypothetical protein
MLKYKLTADEINSVDESVKPFYEQNGDFYTLKVEGAVPKEKLDEFRATNIDLMKKLKDYDGVDLEKYNQLTEVERKMRDKELIEKGDIDTLIKERLASVESDYTAKLNTLQQAVQEKEQNYKQLLVKYEIEGEAMKALQANKIRPEAFDAILTQVKTKFTVDDNGKVIAKDGDKILTGKNGNLTISEFIAQQPDIFKLPNDAGAARGNRGSTAFGGNSSRDKIASGLQKLLK